MNLGNSKKYYEFTTVHHFGASECSAPFSQII
jgi:hypothetical protein